MWPPPLWGTRPPRAEQETLPLLQTAGFLATVKGTWNSGAAAGGEHMPRKPLTVPVPRKYRAEPGKARSASAGLLPPRRGAAGGKSNASCAARALPLCRQAETPERSFKPEQRGAGKAGLQLLDDSNT